MEKFQKYKRDMVFALNIVIILAVIDLVGNFLVDLRFSEINSNSLLAYVVVAIITFGLLCVARQLVKKENLLGPVLTIISGVFLFFMGGLFGEIIGVILVVMAIAYLVTFNKYKKN